MKNKNISYDILVGLFRALKS